MAAAVLFLCLTVVAAAGQRGYERSSPLRQFRFAQLQGRQNGAQNQRQYQNQQRPNQNRNQNQQRPYQPQQRPYQNQQRPYQTQQRPYQSQQRPYQTQQRPYQQTPQYGGAPRSTPAYPANGARPGTPAPTYTRPAYPNANRPGSVYPGAAPPGHLGDWLNQHQGLPVQDQERLLRNDPSFNRLPTEHAAAPGAAVAPVESDARGAARAQAGAQRDAGAHVAAGTDAGSPRRARLQGACRPIARGWSSAPFRTCARCRSISARRC